MSGRLKSNLITAGIVLGLLVVLLVALLFYPFRSADAVQISFLGCTNDVSGIKLAVFVVTNTSNETISYAKFTPEVKIFDIWSTPKCTVAGLHVSPHGTDNYAVPAITNVVPWRVSALWYSENSTPLEVWRNELVGNLSWNWYELQRGHRPKFYAVPRERYYLVFSAAITNKSFSPP